MTRRNKYNAQPTVIDNIQFASKREAKRYGELKLLQSRGFICGLELQPSYPIKIDGKPVKIKSKGYPNGRAAKYIADFWYIEKPSGMAIVEDSKGMDTPVSKLKRALVEAIYGVEIRLV